MSSDAAGGDAEAPSDRMRAVVFQGAEQPMAVEEVERPTADPDEVVVETEACGICRSDWHAWRGDWEWIGVVPTPGLVFGHEPAGRVVEVGDDVDRLSVGDRITNPFNLGDGTCHHCRTGRTNRCEKSVPMGFVPFQKGAFAEYYTVREADHNAVVLPDGVDPVDVAGLGCRFATAFHGLLDRVEVEPGEWVAIHGCGGVGLSAVHVADAVGANVIAVDLSADKLDRARDLGADRTVDVTSVDDVPRAVRDHVPGTRGADVSVDALGIAETCRNAVDSLGKAGRHLQIGMTTDEEAGEIPLPIDTMVTEEREFYGAYGMPPAEYDEIFSMMETGKLDPGRVVGERVSLSEVPEVVESLGEYDTVGIPVCTEF
jgi:alcohol dehydrogenase